MVENARTAGSRRKSGLARVHFEVITAFAKRIGRQLATLGDLEFLAVLDALEDEISADPANLAGYLLREIYKEELRKRDVQNAGE